jgi:hypothetical protein
MTARDVQRMRAVITSVLDLLVRRVAAQPDAAPPVRDAALDLVAALRAAERRCDTLLDELRRA